MWQQTIKRKDFAALLQSHRPSIYGDPVETRAPRFSTYISDDRVDLLWEYDPRISHTLPGVVVVHEGMQRDLLAWIASYVPSSRPLTAYCKVMDRALIETYLALPIPSLGKFEEVCSSLIICELATFLGSKRDALDSSPTACQATLSFVMSRAIALGIPPAIISELPRKWAQTRSLLGTAQSPQQGAALIRVWSVLAQLSRGDLLYDRQPTFPELEPAPSLIVEACRDLMQRGEFSLHIWHELFQDIPNSHGLIDSITGPREGRVALFEAALNYVETNPLANREAAGFLLGYLASAISPGTLDHIQLVVPLLKNYPDILLWYGLLAGLTSRGSLGKNADPLARRVMRELLRNNDFLSAPTCDIAFVELEMNSISSREWRDVRESVPGNLSIELLPSVNSIHRLSRVSDIADAPPRITIQALNEIDNQIRQLSMSVDRLRKTMGDVKYGPVGEQPQKRRIRNPRGIAE